jgi:small subunit ribosomal protein S15
MYLQKDLVISLVLDYFLPLTPSLTRDLRESCGAGGTCRYRFWSARCHPNPLFYLETIMSLTTQETKQILAKYATSANDTGSPEVQVALITERVNKLTDHFKTHSKDHHGRRGLLKLVGQRRRLLNYLSSTNNASYKKLVEQLNLRK